MHVNKKDKQVKLKFKIIHIFINIAIIKIKFVHDNIVITQSHSSQFTSSTIHSSQNYHSTFPSGRRVPKKSDKLEKLMFGVLAGRS